MAELRKRRSIKINPNVNRKALSNTQLLGVLLQTKIVDNSFG